MIPDEEAARHGYLRVIDESGEDYGYTADRFFMLEAPEALAKALRPYYRATPRRRAGRVLQPVVQKARRG